MQLSCSSGSMPKGTHRSSSCSSGSSCKTKAGLEARSCGCVSHPSPSLSSSWNNPGDEGSSASSWNMELAHGCSHMWRRKPKTKKKSDYFSKVVSALWKSYQQVGCVLFLACSSEHVLIQQHKLQGMCKHNAKKLTRTIDSWGPTPFFVSCLSVVQGLPESGHKLKQICEKMFNLASSVVFFSKQINAWQFQQWRQCKTCWQNPPARLRTWRIQLMAHPCRCQPW